MLKYQYICESPPSDEGWTVVEAGSGSIDLATGGLAAGSEHRIALTHGGSANKTYIYRFITPPGAGETVGASFYVKTPSVYYSESVVLLHWGSGARNFQIYHYTSSSQFRFRTNTDAGPIHYYHNGVAAGTTYHIAFSIKRATTAVSSDGEVKLYINGVSVWNQTGIDNYDSISTTLFLIGSDTATATTGDYDFDIFRFGETVDDVRPDGAVPPAVDGELPQAARTVFLFRQNDADSLSLALGVGIDAACLCPLPCSTTETLADYTTFKAQVETALKCFLNFRPSVASQATCIIAGHNVPGYFYNAGTLYSTCSRLMHIDTAFAGAVANPLYGGSERLTATILQAAGVRLAARLDGTTRADCQALYALGNTTVDVAEGEKIFSTLAPTLDVQLLRLEVQPYSGSDIDGDAITYRGSAHSSNSFAEESDSSRLSFIDGVSSDHIRSEIVESVDYGYRSKILAVGGFDFSAFCAMLRNGSCVAEAFAVAAEYVDKRYQLAGWPLLSVIFPKSGYDVFVAPGSADSIDYDNTTKYLPSTLQNFNIDMLWDTQAIVVRKVGPDGSQETRGRIILLDRDDEDNIFQQLPEPSEVTIEDIDPQTVNLSFTCHPIEGQAAPEKFKIFEFIDNDFNPESPVTEIEVHFPGQWEFCVQLNIQERPTSFVVRAYDGNSNSSHISNAVTAEELRIPSTPSFTQE